MAGKDYPSAWEYAQGCLIIVAAIILIGGVMLTVLSGCMGGTYIVNDTDDPAFPHQPLPRVETLVFQPDCIHHCYGDAGTASAENNAGGVTLTAGDHATSTTETLSETETTSSGGYSSPKADKGY